MNNFILLIPLFAILGGVGLSFDSAFAADYVLDETFCTQIGGNFIQEKNCILNENYSVNLGDTLTIPEGINLLTTFDIINNGTIENRGGLSVGGNIDNFEKIDNYGLFISGDILNNKGTITNYGTIENNGTINNYATLDNDDLGTINNEGTITNNNYMSNNGTIENNGTITNQDLFNINGGTINNQGTIDNINDGTINNNSGAINNNGAINIHTNTYLSNGMDASSGSISFGSIASEGIFTNYGTINIEGTLTNNKTLTNYGTIENNGTINNYATLDNDDLGTINNTETIDNYGTLTNYGTIHNNKTITNNYEGSIRNYDTINNYGLITTGNDPAPPGQPEVITLTAQLCQDEVANTTGIDGISVSWIDPILNGYDGTCQVTGPWLSGPTFVVGESVTLIIDNHLILSLKDGLAILPMDFIMKVNGGALVLDNTLMINAGTLEINSGEFIIYDTAEYYNVGSEQTVNIYGTNRIQPAGSGFIAVDSSSSVTIEGSLKNSAAIENSGTINVDLCTGSLENIGGGVVIGTVNEITCNNQPTNPPVVEDNAITCGAGTELFAGECRAIPVRDATVTPPTVTPPTVTPPTVAPPTVTPPTVAPPTVVPQVQETVTPIGLIATVTDTYENGVTTLDIKFNKNFVNYEIDVTQNGNRLLKETNHALGTTATYKVTAQGSIENPIDVKLTSLGIGLPGQEDRWTGPTGLITNVQVVPEFGTIAMMILVVAIVSIVAVTSKSRLIAKF